MPFYPPALSSSDNIYTWTLTPSGNLMERVRLKTAETVQSVYMTFTAVSNRLHKSICFDLRPFPLNTRVQHEKYVFTVLTRVR